MIDSHEKTIKQLTLLLLMSVFLVASVGAEEYRIAEGSKGVIPELDCVIEPSEIIDVGSAVPGVVEIIRAYRSDLVKKGAVIVEIESSVEQAALELAKVRAGLNTAIELRQENVAFGYLTQKRNLELLKKSAISIQNMDQSKTETRIAELQVIQEKDNKYIAGLEYRRAQAILQQRTIRSPVDGVVMERFKSVGEYVEDEPLLRIAQLDPLHVEVIVPVDYLGRIVPGMQAEVTSGLADSGTYMATVERVDRVADAASGTYGVRLSLSNQDYKIPAGLRCRLGFLPLEQKEPEEIAGNSGVLPAKEQGSTAEIAEEPASAPQLESITSDVAAEAPYNEQKGGCYAIGPVEDEKLARQLSSRLEVSSTDLALRNEHISVDSGYFVLAITGSDPEEGARGLKTRLKSAGISDFNVLSWGDYKGRVSLGFYRNPKSAVSVQKQLAAKGFQAEIVPRRKEIKQYWLDVSLKTGTGLPDQFQEIADSLPSSASLKPVVCPQQLAHH